MNDLYDQLHQALEKKLPGTEVQWEMASSDRRVTGFPRQPGPGAVEGAVLVIIFPTAQSYSTLFIQRPAYNGVHGGQIGFPGGKWEPGDSDMISTALRETMEETGINRNEIKIAGQLTSLFIPVSNINVTPVVGYVESLPEIIPDKKEVDYTFAGDLTRLSDPTIIRETEMDIRGRPLMVKFYDYNGHVIWGATAMILHELLVIAGNEGITFRR